MNKEILLTAGLLFLIIVVSMTIGFIFYDVVL